jgi:hypothetical protein
MVGILQQAGPREAGLPDTGSLRRHATGGAIHLLNEVSR